MKPERSELEELARAAAPVQLAEGEQPDARVQEGIGLCLSGGGYRAMLFHLGSLWRLNDAGYLSRLDRVSSVSGGSITAGALAAAWTNLAFDAQGIATGFRTEVVGPIRKMADHTIDVPAILAGLFLPGSVGDHVGRAYRRRLLGEKTLQDLPPHPRFIFNATNLQSGVLWRFAQPYMRDYRVGEVRLPTTPLAVAVAASAAFPPVLSPVVLRLAETAFTPGSGDLQRPPFTTRVVLTDGGVYDNLGLETVWKRYRTVLVSDAGGRMGAKERPPHVWPLQAHRVLSVIDNQVRSLRKRQLIDSYKARRRQGAYWGIRTDIANYGLKDPLPCPVHETLLLANVPTRLKKLDGTLQERLINWGFAVTDAALRRHVDQSLPPPADFPYPGSGMG